MRLPRARPKVVGTERKRVGLRRAARTSIIQGGEVRCALLNHEAKKNWINLEMYAAEFILIR